MSARTAALFIGLVLAMGVAGGCDRADAITPPPEGWGAAELKVAEEYWGTSPRDCASLTIEFDATSFASLAGVEGGTVRAEATQPSAPGTACAMRIGTGMSVWEQCRVVVHEYGHLLGLGHSEDIHSIMWWGTDSKATVGGCNRLIQSTRS